VHAARFPERQKGGRRFVWKLAKQAPEGRTALRVEGGPGEEELLVNHTWSPIRPVVPVVSKKLAAKAETIFLLVL
jgi:hypothetical protein